MEYRYYDLGTLGPGDVVEVTLDQQANVRLMDSSNYQAFKSGRSHSYIGGVAKLSPLRLSHSHLGHWYATVDLGDTGGSLQVGVRVIRAPGG